MAVLLAEQPYIDVEARDRDGLTAVERLVEEQGWCDLIHCTVHLLHSLSVLPHNVSVPTHGSNDGARFAVF